MVDQLNPSSFACHRCAPELEGRRRVVSGPRSPTSRRCRSGGCARLRRAQAIRATSTTRVGSRGVPFVSGTFLLELYNRYALCDPHNLPTLMPVLPPFLAVAAAAAAAEAAAAQQQQQQMQQKGGGGGGMAAEAARRREAAVAAISHERRPSLLPSQKRGGYGG